MLHAESVVPSSSVADDEILEIFFDQAFVPQAFVDILLTSAADHGLNQAQSASSSLLSRLDYYTENLTKELELTIRKLEYLSESLPAAWTANSDMQSDERASISRAKFGRSSKLEYYLDTIGSAVRALDSDMSKIDGQLKELNHEYVNSEVTAERLKSLQLVKTRLQNSSQTFSTVRSILEISVASTAKEVSDIQLTVNVSEFKVSLETLEETIGQSFAECLSRESSSEKNEELLERISQFTEIKPLFKGLDKFYPVYTEFVDNIRKKAQEYLSAKDLGGDFNI